MAEDHRALLHNLILKLETQERPFYRRMSKLNWWAWHITAGIAFLSAVVSALAAALMREADFKSYGRNLLIVVPVIGATATGFLYLYKFREKEALREEGRIELDDIIENAKSLLASSDDDEAYQRAFHQVRERFKQFGLDQHRRDIALRSDEIPRVTHV